MEANPISIIPQPSSVQQLDGVFELSSATKIIADDRAKDAAKLLGTLLNQKISSDAPASNKIKLSFDQTIKKPEGYKLDVTKTGITIAASDSAGFFYGVQTLLQLLPAEVYGKAKAGEVNWQVPCVTITDAPRFGWRGLMLDASRHFQSVECVKRYLDLMAMHKLNIFHWHLVDGHGWRIEIKKYPKLTEVGAWRNQPGYEENNGKYGGFYTQDEVREIVRYAKKRQITIVPEIEMPGHSFATIAAYPHLSCTEEEQEVAYFYDYPCKAQRFPHVPGSDVFCAGKESTFAFLEDVLDEVLELFDSEFIHIGGDEVNKKWWKACDKCQTRKKEEGLKNEHELQSYFIKRMEVYLNSKNRRMIGWDEILEGGLAPNATVMSWTGVKGGIKAAKQGHDVVMSPQQALYFDHFQSRSPLHPPSWPGHNSLEIVYNYEPIPAELNAEQAKHVLGTQANVWTCFINTDELLDLMTYPRACALSEVAWSPKSARDYKSFQTRLLTHLKRLDNLGVNYYVDTQIEIGAWNPEITKAKRLTFQLNEFLEKDGEYLISFIYTKGAHGLDILNLRLLRNGEVIDQDEHKGFSGFAKKDNVYALTLKGYNSKDKYLIEADIAGNGGDDSRGVIFMERK